MLKKIKTIILDLLFPLFCLGCGKEGAYLCEKCRILLHTVPPICFVCGKMVTGRGKVPPGRTCASCQKHSSVYAFFSPYLFENEVIRELIHALKYKRARSIAPVLGGLLSGYLKRFSVSLPLGALLIPIPLQKNRFRVRGFNQSELIASHMLIPAARNTATLIKTKQTMPQTELSGDERRTNVAGAFAVINPGTVQGKIILLVDDVKTTGATIEEAARTLKKAGAKRIWVITVAH